MLRKIGNSPSGFTLTETLISIVLLSIVLAGGMGFYFNSTDAMTRAMRKKIAIEIANENMEKLRNLAYASMTSPQTCIPGATPNVGGLVGTCSITITAVSTYKQMVVNVTWTEPGKSAQGQVSLASYRAP